MGSVCAVCVETWGGVLCGVHVGYDVCMYDVDQVHVMCVHVCAVCTVCVACGGHGWGAGPGDGGDHAKRRSAWGSGGSGLLRALGGGLWAVVMGPSLAALSPPPAFDSMMTTGPFLPPC